MTTTTRKLRGPKSRSAFTLVELLVATGLSGIVLAAVLTSFIFIARAGIALQNYSDMETQARNAMERFAQDARMSSGVEWNTANSVTITIEQSGSSSTATYAYDSSARTFSRTVGSDTQVLITNVRAFAFNAYSIDTQTVSLGAITAATNLATKQVQISLETERAHSALALSTNKVISARFVLRNKRVTA